MTQPFPTPNWPDPAQDPTLPRPIPEDDLSALFETLTGVKTHWYTRGQRQPGNTGGPNAWLVLSVSSYVGLGIDEYRTGPTLSSATPPALISRVSGQRVFTLSCRAESLDAKLRARDLVERLRVGLRTIRAAAFLHGLGIAFADFRAAVALPERYSDEHLLDTMVLDCRFGMAQNVSPDKFDDGGNFVTVNGGSQAPGTPPTIVGTVVGR